MNTALDYQGLRTFIRNIYNFLWEDAIPFLTDLCRWFFLPMGEALQEGADKLLPDGDFAGHLINRVIAFITDSMFNDMSLATFMLGTGLIIYLTYQIAKFVLDIIF